MPKITRHTAAWMFRTRIREAAKLRPNFAGHYILAAWGCGAECLSYAIIDAQTGTVYFEDATVCCWSGNVPDEFSPIDFRLTSKLIVLRGILDEEGSQGTYRFVFERGRLVRLP